MIEIEKESLRRLGQEIAISICIKHPSAYSKTQEKAPVFKDDVEKSAVGILKALMKAELSIRHNLQHYYKRNFEVIQNA
jgi:hypothetical protein